MGDDSVAPPVDSLPNPISDPEPSILSQRLFDDEFEDVQGELDTIMDRLEQELPEIPLGGPDAPQALASKDGGPPVQPPALKGKGADLGTVPKPPVPTPCRTPRGCTGTFQTCQSHQDMGLPVCPTNTYITVGNRFLQIYMPFAQQDLKL